jgi:hypothetical protein
LIMNYDGLQFNLSNRCLSNLANRRANKYTLSAQIATTPLPVLQGCKLLDKFRVLPWSDDLPLRHTVKPPKTGSSQVIQRQLFAAHWY